MSSGGPTWIDLSLFKREESGTGDRRVSTCNTRNNTVSTSSQETGPSIAAYPLVDSLKERCLESKLTPSVLLHAVVSEPLRSLARASPWARGAFFMAPPPTDAGIKRIASVTLGPQLVFSTTLRYWVEADAKARTAVTPSLIA